jgi:hypothetical protein
MPGGDRTGPLGQGPVTGRGAGFCRGFGGGRGPGIGRGFHRGRGPGMGRGISYGRRFVEEDEVGILRREAEYLSSSLETVNKRLEQLEKQAPTDAK